MSPCKAIEHPAELERQFEWALAAREEFQRQIAVPPETLTDIQRAARFVYIQYLKFVSRPAKPGTRHNMPVRFNSSPLTTTRLGKLISASHRRLQTVRIEALDWQEFIRRYDRDFTLFYLDPPYWGLESEYGAGLFSRADFACIADVLRRLNGRFILSLNDRPEVRETFAGFAMEEVTIRYSARHNRSAAELLISNG